MRAAGNIIQYIIAITILVNILNSNMVSYQNVIIDAPHLDYLGVICHHIYLHPPQPLWLPYGFLPLTKPNTNGIGNLTKCWTLFMVVCLTPMYM